MKAYMYSMESGLYEGETFEDNDRIAETNGLTTIEPPTPCKGYVAVFDRTSLAWSLVSINEMKGCLTKLNA